MARDRPARVEGAVDRVHDHAHLGGPVPEGRFPALLGDGGELGPLRGQALELLEDDVLGAAVDGQGAVAPLADSLVDGTGRDPPFAVEQLALGDDHPTTEPEPVCLECALDGRAPRVVLAAHRADAR